MLNRSKKLNAVSTKNTVANFFSRLPFAPFVGLAYQEGKHIVFRFIIECSNLMDFGPKVIIGLFLYEDF